MTMTPRQKELAEMFPEAFHAGTDSERKRCEALAAMGAASEAPDLALSAIADAKTPAECVERFRVRAKKNGNERRFARMAEIFAVDSPDVSTATGGNGNAGAHEERDVGDDVVAAMLEQRGVDPASLTG
jgi:hypothetical protein